MDLIVKCLSNVDQRPDAAGVLQTSFFSSSESTLEDSIEPNEESFVQITPHHSSVTAGGSIVEINHPSGALISVTIPEENSNNAIICTQRRNLNLQNSPSEKEETEGEDNILQDSQSEYSGENVIYHPSIKCYTSNDICLRYFYKDITSIATLKLMISEDIETSAFDLFYVDEDCDNVIVTQRTGVDELIQHAKSIRCKLK